MLYFFFFIKLPSTQDAQDPKYNFPPPWICSSFDSLLSHAYAYRAVKLAWVSWHVNVTRVPGPLNCRAHVQSKESRSTTTVRQPLSLVSVVPYIICWAKRRCTVRGWVLLFCPIILTTVPRTLCVVVTKSATLKLASSLITAPSPAPLRLALAVSHPWDKC